MTALVARLVEAAIWQHIDLPRDAQAMEVWPVYDAMRSSPDWWRTK